MEAEEIAVDWLHWAGFEDARRLGQSLPEGISGHGVRAQAAFDPLPMTRGDLEALSDWAYRHDAIAISFTFAGWTSDAYELAVQRHIPLIRFTFAGNVEPNNAAAHRLNELRQISVRSTSRRKST